MNINDTLLANGFLAIPVTWACTPSDQHYTHPGVIAIVIDKQVYITGVKNLGYQYFTYRRMLTNNTHTHTIVRLQQSLNSYGKHQYYFKLTDDHTAAREAAHALIDILPTEQLLNRGYYKTPSTPLTFHTAKIIHDLQELGFIRFIPRLREKGVDINGAYVVICNEKIYVGSSGQVAARIRNHIYNLGRGRHKSKGLQREYNITPELYFFTYQTNDRVRAYAVEQQIVDLYNTSDCLLNIAVIDVRSFKGVARDPAAYIGRVQSPETKKRVGDANRGRVHTAQSRLNMLRARPRRAIIIDDVQYDSCLTASKALGIPTTTIRCRINRGNDVNYKYAKKKG